jgi:hypothetical protein
VVGEAVAEFAVNEALATEGALHCSLTRSDREEGDREGEELLGRTCCLTITSEDEEERDREEAEDRVDTEVEEATEAEEEIAEGAATFSSSISMKRSMAEAEE